MKKAALWVFPIVLMLMVQITEFSAYAADNNSSSTGYDIQYEKLAGTNDAKDFNSCRSELLSYFNNQIKEQSNREHGLTAIKKSDLDFNNEDVIFGYKVWERFTNYSSKADYDGVTEKLSENGYSWYIAIRTEKTTVYAYIYPGSVSGYDDSFYFCNGKWQITWCYAKKTGSTVPVIVPLNDHGIFENPDKNLRKFIKADKDDDIKVVFAHIGDRNTLYHNYMLGGIVFVNGKAEYIYSSGFGLYADMISEDTPKDIRELLEICSDKMYNNSDGRTTNIKQLFDYDFVMTIIRIYEKYALY